MESGDLSDLRVPFNQNLSEEIRKEVEKKKQLDKEEEAKRKAKWEKFREIQLSSLDDLVNVNSLFTIAVFLGLSFATPNQESLDNRPECSPDVKMEKRLVLYEVISFASFLFSSLVAKSLKIYLNFDRAAAVDDAADKDADVFKIGRGVMFLVSVLASTAGVVFLTLSMIDVIQIKVGKISCGIYETTAAVISLSTLVIFALLVYLPTTFVAIINCMFHF